jgi:hypothetical protein
VARLDRVATKRFPLACCSSLNSAISWRCSSKHWMGAAGDSFWKSPRSPNEVLIVIAVDLLVQGFGVEGAASAGDAGDD